MREIGAFEAKSKLGTVLDWVEQGEEVVITRRGKPIARIVPNLFGHSKAEASAAAARIRARAAAQGGPFNWQDDWKAYRDEGRK